jgi:hypothetical protein
VQDEPGQILPIFKFIHSAQFTETFSRMIYQRLVKKTALKALNAIRAAA